MNFYGVSQFKGAQLAELSSIKNNIVSLHLGGMPVKDEDLKTIGEFVNLRDLNLTFTKINGEGLKYLSGLQHLRQISLSGTGIHINRLRPLAQLKNLRSVSLWNTSIDNKDMASLKNSFPRVSFDLGYKGDTVVAVLAPPVIDIDEEKRVFDQSLSVVLKSPVSAAKIRYTTDGSEPDSISSPLYKKPINIDQSLIIKARAFLPDWISSKTVSVSFYKNSIKADSIYLTTLPEQKFVADARNGNAFTDQLLGTADAGAANWIGYKLNDFAAFLLFKKAVVINSITFGTLIDVSRTIFPPAEIQVWGGADSGSLKLLATVKPAQPTVRQPPYITGIKCILPSQPVKMIKLVAKRVLKIPVLKNPVPNEQQASKQQLKAKSANKQQQPKAPKSKRPKANPAGVIYFDEILLN
ncbi:chitobiase/beta-hexosaminidase C-terminal domain-containing protein [Niabella aurantiaca]|uniref:chitobiase/beta-hexosaminidase C-terminal domain-containing protein n=1 Tax=Niabella aurantiaca TaxID=379900 RepID=UPI001FE0EEF0|nr:chitobiase/beta-hexosaminidase C-terminal domain-containing protein [Niabella aurantiaca]